MLNILRGCSCTGCTAKERNYHIHKRTSKCTVFDFNAACSKVSHICPINCLSIQKPRNESWRIGVSISANTEEGNDIFCFGSEYQCFDKQKNKKKMIFFFGNCESPSTSHCCKKKKWRLFFQIDYPNFRDIMQQIGEKKVASDINEWQMPSVTISDRGELHTDRTKEGMKFATS